MSITLILLTIATIATIFSGQVPEQFTEISHMVALGLPTLLLLTQLLNLGKNSKPVATETPAKPTQPVPAAAAVAVNTQDLSDAAVVQFVARLQEKGRLLDFIMDDITAYDDESVGAAARIVHQGCAEVLNDSFTIETVHAGEEMEDISLADNYDSNSYRLIGKVPDTAPYNGQVLHRGWKTSRINLPQIIESEEHIKAAKTIIAPAEVEID